MVVNITGIFIIQVKVTIPVLEIPIMRYQLEAEGLSSAMKTKEEADISSPT